MNPYELLIPQLLAGLVIVLIARRAVWQARRENEAHKEDVARRRAEHDRYIAQLEEAAANPGLPASLFVTAWARPSVLRVTLELSDPDEWPDIGRVARDVGELVAGLSEYEAALGGRGLALTEAKAEPGRVTLTLTPRDGDTRGERVRQVADALNAALDAGPPAADPVLKCPPLPAGVSAARAEVALAA